MFVYNFKNIEFFDLVIDVGGRSKAKQI